MANDLIFDSRTIYNYWLKVDRSNATGCWHWLGADGDSRGAFHVQRRKYPASHIALILDGRPRPDVEGIMVLHGDTCIAPTCVNPSHLRWGTHDENMADMLRLDRQAKGVSQWKAVLNDNVVMEMRNSNERHAEWARRLNVSATTVERARKGLTWKHLPIRTATAG